MERESGPGALGTGLGPLLAPSFLSRTRQKLTQRVPWHRREPTARRDVRPESATGSLKERPRFSPGPCGSGGPTSAQRRQRPRPPPRGGSDLQVTRGSTPPTTAPGDPSAEVGLAGSLAFLSPRAPGGPCGQEGDSDRLGTPPWPAVLHGEQEGPAHQAVPPSTATTSSRTSASTASL